MKKKLFELNELSKICKELKRKEKKIALCHGVFDLLHPGHIYHFKQAKEKSDVLIVSVTSDENVMKGPGKPFFKERFRINSLVALEMVDYVVLSKEKSGIQVIKKIKPNFYVKGNDYKKSKDDITGKINLEKKEVKKHGGEVIFTTGPVFSSSKIINKEFFYNDEQNDFLKKLKSKYNIQLIIKYIDQLFSYKPLILGETIIDEYVFCNPIGKSGKETYMVLQQEKVEKYLGGILSMAQNLSALVKKVSVLTSIGSIENHKTKIIRELNKNISFNYIINNNSPTILKKRFIESIDNTKLLGIYSFKENEYSAKEEGLLIKKFKVFKKKIDLIILSDYGHGFFSKRVREEINRVNNFIAINAQVNSSSIGYHTISKYKKANLVLMNEKELRHELRDKNSNQVDLIKKLQKKIRCDFIAITQGKRGATIYSTKAKKIKHVPAFARNVVDKVGAGDALFPILAICLKAKIPMDLSLFIASISAAINAENYASRSVLDKVYFKKFIENCLK